MGSGVVGIRSGQACQAFQVGTHRSERMPNLARLEPERVPNIQILRSLP